MRHQAHDANHLTKVIANDPYSAEAVCGKIFRRR
jgi:hypothetical protein